MVLLPAQGMDVPAIAKVAFTSEDRVRDVIGNFNADGFESGRTPSGLTATCRQIGRIRERASHGVDHWELSVSAGGLGTACPCDLYR
jgi:hypothetical protein